MFTLRSVLLANALAASISGFLLNGLLFFLIVWKTPAVLRSYSRIMRVHCISDILYDLVNLVAGVHPTPLAGKIYLLAQGFVTRIDLRWSRLMFSTFFWVCLIAVALLPIDFYFRYESVCHNRELSTRSIALMVFFAYFVTWLHAFPNSLNYLEVGPRPETANFTAELQQFDEWREEVPSYVVTLLGQTKALTNFVFILALNVFSYSIIAYTSLRIHRTLKQSAVHSSNAKAQEMQRQVSRILALQAILPLVVISFPMSGIVSLAMAGVDAPKAGAYGSAVYYWLSAIKPAATIFIVPRFREFTLQKIFGVRSTAKVGTTTISSTVGQNGEMGGARERNHEAEAMDAAFF